MMGRTNLMANMALESLDHNHFMLLIHVSKRENFVSENIRFGWVITMFMSKVANCLGDS